MQSHAMHCSRSSLPLMTARPLSVPLSARAGGSCRPRCLQQPLHINSASASPLVRRRCQAAAATTDATAADAGALPALEEINQTNYDAFIHGQGEKLVLVDFYTEWCGPCKVILPELVKLQEARKEDLVIVKFNCNKQNKELGVKLNIRVAPTFHLYHKGVKMGDMTGAKLDALIAMIDKAMAEKP